ncbi:60S ribosomal protein L3 [Orbilia oligospora]|uniref:60S ribosomal protein L3 n=1 Tax=Orbilia oligospora TaxID=2813651 RepID=A0A7C8N2Y4_ORBOL|nr:60S ribosomal protein L3 [Orbilia oligospora]KAF3094405.1 60S ribosomal protein L3 [Orbilia oligospora]KAF3120372.1 60S ribosomal protein L3 [Orbilia oligospora]KAF3120724.1 60S ribosomal protein L3 [Orbilia oligospora]
MDLPPASPEEVLSQAFDRLSHSHSPTSIQIGLDAIDEYLALVCSTPVPICSPVAAKISIATASTTLDPQEKLPYPTSPWIKEFRKLQDGFQYNIALRLVGCIDRILIEKKNSQQDIFLTSCLQCLQGTLLLHPESRNLFAREAHMAIFVQLLTRRQPLDLRVLTIDTLVSALLECPANMRTFEALNGLQTISLLFRNRQTPERVRLRVIEFLYFYLLPEVEDSQGHQRNRYQMRESGYSSAQVVVIGNERVMGPKTRSIEQKEEMLGKHLKGIEGIVRDIRRVVS